MLLWGVIGSVGWLSQYAIETLATDFAERWPLTGAAGLWNPGPLWGGLGTVGGVSSSIIEW